MTSDCFYKLLFSQIKTSIETFQKVMKQHNISYLQCSDRLGIFNHVLEIVRLQYIDKSELLEDVFNHTLSLLHSFDSSLEDRHISCHYRDITINLIKL